MSGINLVKVQHGIEAVAGTLVAATMVYPGEAEVTFEDKVELPDYTTGFGGGSATEETFMSQTGTTLTLKDTPCSVELLAYMLQAGVKTTGSGTSSFAFAFPTTAANTISSYTWEFATALQEYEAGYGFLTDFSIKADGGANNGKVMFNGIVRARKAAASTVTASLSRYSTHEPLMINGASKFSIDAAGTAAGTASHLAATLRGFSMDVKTGWFPGHYADARTANDFSVPEGGGTAYEITGNIKLLLNATSVTELANSRAGTSRMVYIALDGTSSRKLAIALPLVFTSAPKLATPVENGLIMCEFPYRSKYSRTSTAQGPSITGTTSAALTIT